MPVAGGGFDQCYNAQAAVAALATCWWWRRTWFRRPTTSSRSSRRWTSLRPCLRRWARPRRCSRTQAISAVRNVEACEKAGVEPVIAMGRQPHHPPPLAERFRQDAGGAGQSDTGRESDGASAEDAGKGRDLYACANRRLEPVFGIIKSVLGFRQFSMRGLEKARGEWSLVTMAWNIKRMFALNPA